MSQILQDLIKELRDEVKQVRETQLEHGFIINENKDNLAEHMLRTKIAEKRLDVIETLLAKFNEENKRTDLLETRVDSLEENNRFKKYSWKLISKIVAGVAGVIAFGITIYKFFEELLK
jgi:hypothetical protein